MLLPSNGDDLSSFVVGIERLEDGRLARRDVIVALQARAAWWRCVETD